MTAPVTTEVEGTEQTMSFMVPSRFTMQTVPQPTNENVVIKEVEARKVAVITFSWYATDARNARKAEELRQWIKEDTNLKIIEGPITAGYDAPFTPPWNRITLLSSARTFRSLRMV